MVLHGGAKWGAPKPKKPNLGTSSDLPLVDAGLPVPGLDCLWPGMGALLSNK